MELKICYTCKVSKPLSDFYKNDSNSDGHAGSCKACIKAASHNRFIEKMKDPILAEKEKARNRQRGRVKYVNPDNNKNWIKKFPEKRRASSAANVVKPPEGMQRHHWSYNDADFLDVIFLTFKQHKKAHRFMVYDQETKMYRRYDTLELLNTREKHEIFIKGVIENKPD